MLTRKHISRSRRLDTRTDRKLGAFLGQHPRGRRTRIRPRARRGERRSRGSGARSRARRVGGSVAIPGRARSGRRVCASPRKRHEDDARADAPLARGSGSTGRGPPWRSWSPWRRARSARAHTSTPTTPIRKSTSRGRSARVRLRLRHRSTATPSSAGCTTPLCCCARTGSTR